MKNIFSPFAKLIAVAACALTLGSCSRAEYAMLPKGGSYHGVTRVATPVPTAPVASPAPAADVVVAPAMALETTTANATPATTKLVAKAAEPAASVAAARALGTASTVVATPAPKLNVLQRVALNKVTRKVDKLMQKSGTVRQHDNTASTARGGISGNLRTGLILLLVGLLVSIFGGIFGLIGAIIAVIGLVFIILWLLDQA